jgi:hypothetical protein
MPSARVDNPKGLAADELSKFFSIHTGFSEKSGLIQDHLKIPRRTKAMSYALHLTIVSRKEGATTRIASLNLTDEVTSERVAVVEGLKAGNRELAPVLDLLESEDDGVQIPLRAFGRMDRNEILRTINGVEVNGGTFNHVERAAREIEQKIVEGWTPELFLQLA